MTAPRDPQSRAFREAGAADRWDGSLRDLAANAEVSAVHGPIADVSRIQLPHHYEFGTGWDADRDGPKTIEQAREALAVRIADPAAPDSEAEAGVYGIASGDA